MYVHEKDRQGVLEEQMNIKDDWYHLIKLPLLLVSQE